MSRQDLQMGYNDLLVIPAGATNIRIAEVHASMLVEVSPFFCPERFFGCQGPCPLIT